MFRKLALSSLLLVLSLSPIAAQQVSPRIEGLEGNAEYMSLLKRDAQLKIEEDSIVNVVEKIRHNFRTDESNRQRYSQEILTLEAQLFVLRGEKGKLVDKISSIEQAWVLSMLDAPSKSAAPASNAAAMPKIDESGVRRLTRSVQLKELLSAADYATLCRAEALEPTAANCVTAYINNYHTLADLQLQYNAADNEQLANGIYGKYKTLTGLNGVLSDSLKSVWTYIYDNKSYAYGYLLEKLDKDEILSAKAEAMASAARKIAAASGEYESDVVASYFIQKRYLTDYELSVAELLGTTAARDSLKVVAAQIADVDYRLPKIIFTERSFIDYEPLEFTQSRYGSRSPIPECRVYERGTLYRILLGEYSSKQSAAAFRGAAPLSYARTESGKYAYYAGCFAKREEADEALNRLKAKGFRRPQIVVWNDGVSSDVTPSGDADVVPRYRIEIVGAAALSEELKSVVKELAAGCELTRVGDDTFVVSAFEDAAAANRVADAMRQADTSVEIKVVEIE